MLALTVTTTMAEGGLHQEVPRYQVQDAASQSNPRQPGVFQKNQWSLPQPLVSPPEFQPSQETRSQSRQRGGRFVTPDILESLKQQQRRYQVMPENQQPDRYEPRQHMNGYPDTGLLGQGSYSYPPRGMGYSNPLYDSPAVSPWGNDADILYRGESFPMIPSEAIGGLPPIYTPSFGMSDGENRAVDESAEPYESNVFNPFTFLPNRSFREP